MKTVSMEAIERRAWQLHELFYAIDMANSSGTRSQDASIELSTLGRALCKELSEYVNGERERMMGTDC